MAALANNLNRKDYLKVFQLVVIHVDDEEEKSRRVKLRLAKRQQKLLPFDWFLSLAIKGKRGIYHHYVGYHACY